MVYIRLAAFLNSYNLHDSIVENIAYNEVEHKIVINLELCLWKQPSYKETEPEIKKGYLTFTGVSDYNTEPISFKVESNEILDADLLSSTNDGERIRIVLTGEDDVRIVFIQAENVEWNEVVD